MKLHSIKLRIVLATVCGIGLAAGILAHRAQADPWDKKTILTVNQPIQVTDTLLQPGQYVLKLAESSANRHIVQIFNSDQSHVINTILAIPNYRLEPTGHSQFMFWETPPGHARALRAWFYPGDNFGQEFRYPKQLAMLQTTETRQTTITEAPPPEPPQVEETPAPAPEPQEQTVTKEEKKEETVEIAQNNPPPAPAAPPPPPAEQPSELPKTATPYPLIGLGGVVALALYGLLRLKRLA